MKRIIFLLLVLFAFNSCSKDAGNGPAVYYELVPIQRCSMPYRFTAGQTYEFEMTYRQPSSCHFYKGIYFEKLPGNVRLVAIQCGVMESNSCVTYPVNSTSAPNPQKETYQFTAEAGEPYTFRIWSGKDDQGENTYYDVVVPVDN
ncbi:MAG TPA: hypothetical protein PLS51_00865 [Flavobacterium sp.]|jgi:hypothetical protein|nr:hypothetical protein [Flavobacterium sp.]HPJ09149.1 hypothetical protein [Flavobacterium sp.]